MKSKQILLTAALAVIISAITAQAAPKPPPITITQSQLPLIISTPGTYVLTGDLTLAPGSNLGAISIIHNLPGPVVIDLKGFTINGPGGYSTGSPNSGILIHTAEGYNTYPITVQNGTIKNFYVGISVGEQKNIKINNIYIYEPYDPNYYQFGVIYERCNSSTVNNCTFNALGLSPTQAITDYESTGGNNYSNNTFIGQVWDLLVQNPDIAQVASRTLKIDRCQFAPPPTP